MSLEQVWWQTPKYEYRGNGKREIHFADGERLLLTVDTSTIPNSGKGLFLTYLGNDDDEDDDHDTTDTTTNNNNSNGNGTKKWAPTQIVDLGVYAPHIESDIKSKHIMEVKFFVYDQSPAVYCFSGPSYKEEDYNYMNERDMYTDSSAKEKKTASVCTNRSPQQLRSLSNTTTKTKKQKNTNINHKRAPLLYGKKLNDVFYDVSCEKKGKLHEFAQSSLLPYANESTPEMQQRSNKNGNPIFQRPCLSALFHPDGTLHYVLSPTRTFYKNVITELFVYYGKDYQGVRDRNVQYTNHIPALTPTLHLGAGNGNNPLLSGNQSIVSSSQHSCYDNRNSSTTRHVHNNNTNNDDLSSCQNDEQYVHCTICKNNWIPSAYNSITTPLDDDNFPNIGYTAIRKAISTFNEQQVVDILHYFLQYPPDPSDARRRMWWLTDQIRTYCQELLYYPQKGVLPNHICILLEEALTLFPRHNNHSDQDIHSKHQYLGEGVRMLRTNYRNNKKQWLNGFVEHVVFPQENEEWISYKIVFINGQHCFLNEDEVQKCLFNGGFGFI